MSDAGTPSRRHYCLTLGKRSGPKLQTETDGINLVLIYLFM